MNWQQHIMVDPLVCHGAACIAGTRVMVSAILDNLAEGCSESHIIAEYPSLSHDDIMAAVAYGAELARERVVYLHAA